MQHVRVSGKVCESVNGALIENRYPEGHKRKAESQTEGRAQRNGRKGIQMHLLTHVRLESANLSAIC